MNRGRRKGWKAVFAALLALGAVLWANAAAVLASQADPRFGVYVQDEAGLINETTEILLYTQAVWLYEQTGSAQIGVVTVNDLGGRTIEEFAVARFRAMGLGSRERNDGVLLLYAKEENRVRIEVGYGMEGRINDGKAGAILDQYFVPYRDTGRLNEAFLNTQSALIIEMAAEYGIDASGNVMFGEDLFGGERFGPPADGYEEDEFAFLSDIPLPVKILGAAVIVLLLFLDFKFTGGAITYAILNLLFSRGGGGGRSGGRGGGGSSGGGGASR